MMKFPALKTFRSPVILRKISRAFSMSPGESMKLLGLKPGFTKTQLQESYARAMKKLHPDHGGSDLKKFHRAREAFETLRDFEKHKISQEETFVSNSHELRIDENLQKFKEAKDRFDEIFKDSFGVSSSDNPIVFLKASRNQILKFSKSLENFRGYLKENNLDIHFFFPLLEQFEKHLRSEIDSQKNRSQTSTSFGLLFVSILGGGLVIGMIVQRSNKEISEEARSLIEKIESTEFKPIQYSSSPTNIDIDSLPAQNLSAFIIKNCTCGMSQVLRNNQLYNQLMNSIEIYREIPLHYPSELFRDCKIVKSGQTRKLCFDSSSIRLSFDQRARIALNAEMMLRIYGLETSFLKKNVQQKKKFASPFFKLNEIQLQNTYFRISSFAQLKTQTVMNSTKDRLSFMSLFFSTESQSDRDQDFGLCGCKYGRLLDSRADFPITVNPRVRLIES